MASPNAPTSSVTDSKIVFTKPLNVSVQVGDALYESVVITANPGETFTKAAAPQYIGFITEIGVNYIKTDGTPNADGGFYTFLKNNSINSSSIIGEWAEVTIKNNSKEKAEIFTLGSEIAMSSK